MQIYEQSQLANEIGAAIHITPNANSILSQLGIDHEEQGGTRLRQVRISIQLIYCVSVLTDGLQVDSILLCRWWNSENK